MKEDDFGPLTYDDTKITTLLKQYTLKRIIFSIDFLLAMQISLMLVGLIGVWGKTKEAIALFSPMFISVAGVLIGLTIAGLAIIVSMWDMTFIKKLARRRYSNILLLYWMTAFSAGACIVINIFSSFYISIESNNYILMMPLLAVLFSFLYALGASIMIVSTTLRFGLYRAAYSEINEKNN